LRDANVKVWSEEENDKFTFISTLIVSFLLTELPQTQSWARPQIAQQTASSLAVDVRSRWLRWSHRER
jgi:hypothetical protein